MDVLPGYTGKHPRTDHNASLRPSGFDNDNPMAAKIASINLPEIVAVFSSFESRYPDSATSISPSVKYAPNRTPAGAHAELA